jgi:uncharacterized protein HemX
VSVISFPRRIDSPSDTRLVQPRGAAVHRERVPRRRALTSLWRNGAPARKAGLILSVAIALSLGGSMYVANRQVEIHQLQDQLLQDQSTYAVQVGFLTNKSAPSQIASNAGALHLVEPVAVTQVPSTSLDVILPLPKFSGYAPVTSRTIR